MPSTLTAEVEPVVPFTLGVRIKNNGQAAARNLKIDSAQPKIIENQQGLLINFGDIAAYPSKTGRQVRETSLSGKFIQVGATFGHADRPKKTGLNGGGYAL